MSASGSLTISSGSQIGYREPLATNSSEIKLGAGNHFLLGRNGRGKTTLLRSIAQSIPLLAGKITRKGSLVFLSEDLSFDRELYAPHIIKCLVPRTKRTEALEFADKIELNMDKPFAELSTGNKRKLSITVGEFTASSMAQPVLLLDEPYTGLDDFVRSCIRERWESTADQVCRLIVAHPDQDDFLLPSALTISSGKLTQLASDQSRSWGQIRSELS